MRKKFLPLWIFLTLAGINSLTAAPVTQLDEVVVTADRTEEASAMPGDFIRKSTTMGLAGKKNIMEVPYTAQSLSQKSIATMTMPTRQIDQALANVPSIRTGTSPIKTDFSIRGIGANGSSLYLNNIPGFFIMCAGPEPNTIEHADVLIGPAATLSGSVQSYNGPDGGQPGSIYLYTKRPEASDFSRYTQSFSGYGDWGEYIDISRNHLGNTQSWGIRIYGQHDRGGLSSINGAGSHKRNLSVDISHESDKSKTNIFGSYYDYRIYGGERRFSILRNALQIPSAPETSLSYDDPHYMHQNTYGYLLTVNHEQKINDHLGWFLNAGMNETTIRRFIFQSQIILDGNGDLSQNKLWSQYFFMKNRYGQAGLKANFKTGAVQHDMSISIDRAYRVHYNNNKHVSKPADNLAFGNIYTGILFSPKMYSWDDSQSLPKMFMLQEMDTSINIVDNMTIGKWNILAAGTRRHENFRGKAPKNKNKADSYAPTFGVSYQPNKDTSFYAAYAKSTSRSAPVYGGYENDGELLEPMKLTQKEIGVKHRSGNVLFTLSYFDMDQPNAIDVDTDGKIYYKMDGRNRYRGVDFTVNGSLSDKWNIFGGFEYLHARQESTAGGVNDGLPTDGSAKWSAVLGAEYKPNEKWSITGRMEYQSKGVIIGSDRRELSRPSFSTFDLFTSYKTQFGKTPVTFRASVYNLFNKNYWRSQPGQGNKLMLSMPRTYILSASFDF